MDYEVVINAFFRLSYYDLNPNSVLDFNCVVLKHLHSVQKLFLRHHPIWTLLIKVQKVRWKFIRKSLNIVLFNSQNSQELCVCKHFYLCMCTLLCVCVCKHTYRPCNILSVKCKILHCIWKSKVPILIRFVSLALFHKKTNYIFCNNSHKICNYF